MSILKMYTDGGARRNGQKDNIGAFAVIAVKEDDNVVAISSKTKRNTTNNEMELYGIYTSIKLSTMLLNSGEYTQAIIHSDSMYSINIVKDWMWKWEQYGWRRAKGDIKNLEIIQDIYNLLNSEWRDSITFVHVKGHSGDRFNEMADSELNRAMDLEEECS